MVTLQRVPQVKCNNDPMVLQALQSLGTGFDCASAGEIALMTSLGVPSTNIIYANPCKQVSHLVYAQKVGVTVGPFPPNPIH